MNASVIYCATCGAANPPDATACFACGKPPLAAPAGAAIGSGSLLKQRYRLLAQIGAGGFGAVYRAEDTELGNRSVAIKEMQPRGLTPEEAREAIQNFRQEALLLAGLTHPNLPRIYEQFNESGHWYLVMDYIEGETLEAYASRAPGRRLPVPEVLKIAAQLCEVLDYLHTRQPPIIFRDLKPANIMRTPAGHLYLIDFGIARHFKPGQTKDTVAFGSAGYAAPEQYGRAQTTARSDIYSLGATLHQLLSGSDPSDSPFVFAPLHLAEPAGLEALIMQMLEADQAKRPASVALIQRDLERMAQELASGHKPPRPQAAPAHAPTASVKVPLAVPAHAPAKNPLRPLLIYHGHTERVNTIAWSPDGKYLASGSNDKTIQIWDSATGKKRWDFPGQHRVDALAWSPNGAQLAWVGEEKGVHLWNAQTGEFSQITHRHLGFLMGFLGLAWSPDASCLAAGGMGTTVEVWEVKTGKHLLTYKGHQRFLDSYPVYALAWSPNGEWIASASTDGIIHVWEAATGHQRCTYNGFQLGYRGGVAWSPDGKYLASAGDKATVHIWEAANGRQHLLLGGHKGAVNALAWSPDGKHVASGGSDQTVRVWGAVTGKELHVYSHHNGGVNALAWSPDSTRLASAGDDQTVKIWQYPAPPIGH